jgi:hypothetical protein
LDLPEGGGLNLKKEIKIVVLSIAVVTLLCLTAFGPVRCNAAVIWSEDFNTVPPDWLLRGCDVDEGWLRMNGSMEVAGDPACVANRSSSVTVGTWEFDLIELGATGGWLGVWFMADGSDFATSNYYAVQLTRSSTATGSIPVFGLYRNFEEAKVKLASYDGPESPQGAHHITFTRNSAGQIKVYLNGTAVIDVTDTEIDESTYFVFWAIIMDTALDNVVVNDDLPPPPPPPWWWLVIVAGGVIIIVVAAIVLKRKR